MGKWVAVAGVACLWFFTAGLFIGRAIPKHHFERFGNSPYLFDTSTGYVCKAVGPSTSEIIDSMVPKDANPVDQAIARKNTDTIPACPSQN